MPSHSPSPAPSSLGKHALIAFALAVLVYALSYAVMAHLRVRKGAWEVVFQSDARGIPSLTVGQRFLGLSNIQFRFPEETISTSNLSQRVLFDGPKVPAPFGNIRFIDPTFLPGTVAFDFFGHELQLIPRVLTLNRREIPWQSGAVFELLTTNKPPPAPPRPAKKSRSYGQVL